MTVKIKRNTGSVGPMGTFNVLVNGEKTATLPDTEILELEIPDDEAVIQLSQMGVKTNEMNVKDGDRLEVSTTFWGKYGIILIISLFFISDLFARDVIRYGIFLLYFITAYVIDGFIYKTIKIPRQAIIRNKG